VSRAPSISMHFAAPHRILQHSPDRTDDPGRTGTWPRPNKHRWNATGRRASATRRLSAPSDARRRLAWSAPDDAPFLRQKSHPSVNRYDCPANERRCAALAPRTMGGLEA
jgi:hypothetical protein